MRVLVSLALLALVSGQFGAATVKAQAQPAGAKQPSAEEAAFTANVNKLWGQYNASYGKQELEQAHKVIGEILALVRQRFGNRHDSVAVALDTQAQIKAHLGDTAASKKAADEQIVILTALYGADHWRTATAKARVLQFVKLGQLSAEERKRVRDTNQISAAALQHVNKAEYAKAVELYESSLAIRRQLLGDDQLIVATTLREVGSFAIAGGNRDRSEAALRESVSIFERLVGKKHLETAFSRNQLALAVHAAKRHEEAERLFLDVLEVRKELLGSENQVTLVTMENLADLYDDMDEDEKARDVRVEQLAIQRKVLGEEHASTAQTMHELANTYDTLNQNAQAQELFVRCLAIRRKLLGVAHYNTIVTMADLATLYEGLGQFAKAEPLRNEILATNLKLHGEENIYVAANLHASGELQNNLGHYPLAFEQVSKAVEIRQKLLGSSAAETLKTQRLLASVNGNMGNLAAQERLLVTVLAGYRKLHGEEHLATAATLRDLGIVYLRNNEFAKADEVLTKSLAIVRKLEREPAADTVLGLLILGGNYLMMGKYAQAEKTLQESIESCRTWLGPENSFSCLIELFLATSYQMQGKLPEAESVYRKSLAGSARMLGPAHPIVTMMRSLVAMILYQRGKYDEAFAELKIAMARAEQDFQVLGQVLSDDESIATSAQFRGHLETAIEFSHGDPSHIEEIYPHVARFKGQVLARQSLRRAVADSPEVRDAWKELEQTAADLAAHSRTQPVGDDVPNWQSKLEALTQKLRRLTARINQASGKVREARAEISTAEITAALPHDAALVDFVQYKYAEFPKPGDEKPFAPEQRLAAFIVRPGRSLKLLHLGAVQPLAEAIDAWRSDFGSTAEGRQAASKLRELLWLPIEKELEGAKLVLVSPEGELARLPLGALPGKAPASYLLEDWTITLIPSAQAIPELFQNDQAAVQTDGNLLLIGGVDYGRRPGESEPQQPRPFKDFQSFAARGTGKLEFGPLPGAKDEMVVIERSYAELIDQARRGMTVLEGPGASEEAFRRLAPRHVFLHVATHGFFAPPEIKSALARPANAQVELLGELVTQQSIAGFHPGLLSGLALARANNSPREGDDGILTAQEVSTLDLRGVKLVVLSACETGLGQVAGGEGLLGLQRAFQAAGARSVIATLWKVDDLVTRDLMKRFYDNLWNKGLSKIEALREAQLWALRERGARGLVDADEQTKRTNRLPPLYWAAFTLSGDWR